ncbi:MAG: elongation factor P [Spirochaetales bacterium]|nr:elongation factor P [Spirochaetales bacterium]
MVKAGSISKGDFILVKDSPHLVAEREFVNPGKGSAFVRLKLKNLITGQVLKQTVKSQESLEDIDVAIRNFQFLYSDAESSHFMDAESYEQYVIPAATIEEKRHFIKEGDTYQLVLWENNPIDLILPYKMEFKVIEAHNAIKGDTVTGATKTSIIETGLEIRVPLFIKTGDTILVNTETKEYVERVNK